MILRCVGALLLAVGLVGLYYGPLELYCFYLFAPGRQNRFPYEGFTVGSLWFAYLVAQNTVYYLAALFCIPVGVGMLRLRPWAHTLALSLLLLWTVTGASLCAMLGFSFAPLSGRFGSEGVLRAGLLLLVLMLVLPLALQTALRSSAVRREFGSDLPQHDAFPTSGDILVFAFGMLWVVFLHISIFFRCFYPWFGEVLMFRDGVYVLSGAIWILCLLLWMHGAQRAWALPALAAYFGVTLVSYLTTLLRYPTAEIIRLLGFSGQEQRLISDNLPWTLDLSLVALVGAWLGLTLLAVIKVWLEQGLKNRQENRRHW